ncbi:hypothetical protein NLI96_g6008 [Meripilus lineatus]|uniref:MYND-type domain-containing protein n=1 Tax=Meripilus lineatus TaxID=2056292 RepID=A0AAD5YII5_9APHY|nr:hypothetical protein NLI96_g6008 [Physisporinus lineatus]
MPRFKRTSRKNTPGLPVVHPSLPKALLDQLQADPLISGHPSAIFVEDFEDFRCTLISEHSGCEAEVVMPDHYPERSLRRYYRSFQPNPGHLDRFREGDRRTFLYMAVCDGDLPLAYECIRIGMAVDFRDKFGCTPLLVGCYVVRTLEAAKKAVTGRRRSTINSPYEKAMNEDVISKRIDRTIRVITLLVEQHADVNISANNGDTPFSVISNPPNWTLMRLLVRHGAQIPSIIVSPSIASSVENKTRFKDLCDQVLKEGETRPPRPCPCWSGRLLSECHAAPGTQPASYPPNFLCQCGSRKTYEKCCTKRDFQWVEEWYEPKRWIRPFEVRESYISRGFGITPEIQAASERVIDNIAAANGVSSILELLPKNRDAMLKELHGAMAAMMEGYPDIDPAFQYAILHNDFYPRPWLGRFSKVECKKRMDEWNHSVDEYIRSSGDPRSKFDIELEAKIGIGGGPLYKKCEAEGCTKVESRDVVQMKRCRSCKMIFYCSNQCQRSHWKEHKRDCKSKSHPEQQSVSQSAQEEMFADSDRGRAMLDSYPLDDDPESVKAWLASLDNPWELVEWLASLGHEGAMMALLPTAEEFKAALANVDFEKLRQEAAEAGNMSRKAPTPGSRPVVHPSLPKAFIDHLQADPLISEHPSAIFMDEVEQFRLKVTSKRSSCEAQVIMPDDHPQRSLRRYYQVFHPIPEHLDSFRNGDQRTFLHMAACDGDVLLAYECIRIGTAVDFKDQFGCTALMLGCYTVRTLEAAKKAVTGRRRSPVDSQYDKAMNKDVISRRIERTIRVITLFVEQHADVNTSANNGDTPFSIISNPPNWTLMRLFIQHGAKIPSSFSSSPIVSSPANKTRFKNLFEQVLKAGEARPPRPCPCWSGKLLSECHASPGTKPYPQEFLCLCGSRKIYEKCCTKKDFEWVEEWYEPENWIRPVQVREMLMTNGVTPEIYAASQRGVNNLVAASAGVSSYHELLPKTPEGLQKEIHRVVSGMMKDHPEIDPAFQYAVLHNDFMARPWLGRLSKVESKKRMEEWNHSVEEYIKSSGDTRQKFDIELEAKIGMSGVEMFAERTKADALLASLPSLDDLKAALAETELEEIE